MINKSMIVAVGFAALAAVTSSAVTASTAHRTVSRNGEQSFATVPTAPGIFNSWGGQPSTVYVPGFGNIGAGAGPGGY
jgi:hypothetical protein